MANDERLVEGRVYKPRTPFEFKIECNEKGIFAYRETTNAKWIKDRIEDDDSDFLLFYVFHTSPENVEFYDNPDNGETIVRCKIGERIDGGYLIPNDVLSSKWNLKIRDGVELDSSFFTGFNRLKTMTQILDLIGSDVTIGNEEGDLSRDTLVRSINRFPNKTEIDHYIEVKVTSILSEDLNISKDYSLVLARYLKNKDKQATIKSDIDTKEYDLQKFTYVRDKMLSMIDTFESYLEKDWQIEIAKIIRILFPQYIIATREQTLTELFGHSRRVDFLLVNSSGYIDLMEIKDPSVELLVKREDHNNIVPSRRLSDCAMQIENYLFALSQSESKEKVEKNLKKELPDNFNIHILNPRGLIVMGYSKTSWNEKECHALEVIRRHYAHIADVITYNDLIERLNNIIKQFEKQDDDSDD